MTNLVLNHLNNYNIVSHYMFISYRTVVQDTISINTLIHITILYQMIQYTL